jgi:N-acylneuraminate cytidylyltransferase
MEISISALLPMKGHSERVPSKNIKPFAGKPLCHYVLNALQQSRYVKEILIDTDSDQIKSLVQNEFSKVVIVDRPQAICGTKVPMTPIIEHDLTIAKYEHFIQVHATTPLLCSVTIDAAIECYLQKLSQGNDSLMGVNKYQTRFYNAIGKPINHDPAIMVPSQDMPPMFEDNSCFYINSKTVFYSRRDRVGSAPVFYEVPKLEAIDIDDNEQFLMAEAVYTFLQRSIKE